MRYSSSLIARLVGTAYVISSSKIGKRANKFVLIYFIIFLYHKEKRMLWKQLKVSCFIIHFLMFAFTVSVNVIFPVASVSLPRVSDWPEKTAVIQVIVLVQASHL